MTKLYLYDYIIVLRSKRITVREAQKSEPSPKENKPSPRKQVQGDHERKMQAQEAWSPKEETSGRKRNPRQEIKENSQDPQQPSRGTDPSRRTVKGRLRQLERKGQEKKIRNRVEATSAKRPSKKRRNNQRPLMAQVGSVSGNQNREIWKEEWQQVTFKSAEWVPPRWEKGQKRNC